MNDFLTPESGDTPSTIIDNNAPLPGSAEFQPEATKEPDPVKAEELSLEDTIKKAHAEVKEKAEGKEPAKPEPKKEPAPKEKPTPERGENGKFTAKPKAEVQPEETQEPSGAEPDDGGDTEQERGDARPSEGRDTSRAPAQFLPRAKEKWGSVDPEVQAEVHRMEEEFQRGKQAYEEDREFRRGLRQYEDMAKQAGTTVADAMKNYVAIDQELRTNPENALKRVLATINLTPEQYAQHVLGQKQQQAQNPQAYAQNQQTQQLQGQIQQLQQQIQQLTQGTREQQEAARLAEVERTVIAPFRAEHPRYDELQGDIAFFLNNGRVPSNLPERQRLEVAYDMAERLNPAPSYASRAAETRTNDRPLNPAGSKSVKGSPSYGAEAPRNTALLSLDEALAQAARSVAR